MSEKLYTSADLAHWYSLGAQHERERIAAADHEHTQAWAKLGERVSGARHAELMRLFAERAEALGRKLYHGGPVVWP